MKQLLDKMERKNDSHKGENGKVAVIAGSKDYTGTPALAAKASLRTGCDLAHILTSQAIERTVAAYSENFIVSGYRSNYFSDQSLEKAKEIVEWSDSVLIGPGMSHPDSEAIQVLISYIETPCVIDADAIEPALEADITEAIFTPHQEEAEYIREEYGSIQDFVEKKDAVVVLKGQKDRIYTSEGLESLKIGNSSMTVGGTGDTLAGVIASLISQGLDTKDAAKLGAWINGKAGEKASERMGDGMLATDLIEYIPDIIQD